MKLKRNIKEFPPLTGRLQRRFLLPGALDIFRRLSLRLDLRRIWPDLPYMSFLRRAEKPGVPSQAAAPQPVQHSSFQTNIALSPVITKIVREEYTLPVRELVFGEREREQLAGSAPAPDHSGGESRLVRLVQVVDRQRPSVVRSTTPLASEAALDSREESANRRDDLDADNSGAGRVASREAQVQLPDRATLESVAREHGLEPESLESMADFAFGGEREEFSPTPILPPEMQEFLKLDVDSPPAGKRYAAKRARRAADGQDDSEAALTEPRAKAVAVSPKTGNPELLVRSDTNNRSGDDAAADGTGRTPGRFPAGNFTRDSNHDAALAVREARRPVIEREDSSTRVSSEREAPSEAVQAAMVQDTVRKTLRTLPEPDVEAFANRISRSLERRMQIDRDWRGDL